MNVFFHKKVILLKMLKTFVKYDPHTESNICKLISVVQNMFLANKI